MLFTNKLHVLSMQLVVPGSTSYKPRSEPMLCHLRTDARILVGSSFFFFFLFDLAIGKNNTNDPPARLFLLLTSLYFPQAASAHPNAFLAPSANNITVTKVDLISCAHCAYCEVSSHLHIVLPRESVVIQAPY